jgi:CheY-like chemotaxis protein
MKLLLVDDDEDDRDFFLEVVETITQNVECTSAQNGLDAWRLLNEKAYIPNLIFLDLNMPVMNGKQFLSEIKKNTNLKDIPVIILSTSSDESIIKEVKNLGASDFITKPNKLSLLELRLREVFAHQINIG